MGEEFGKNQGEPTQRLIVASVCARFRCIPTTKIPKCTSVMSLSNSNGHSDKETEENSGSGVQVALLENATFLHKLYAVLADKSAQKSIEWCADETSFVISDPKGFISD